ncbi:MAG: ATP-binding protein [Bacteroidales bacterium]|nr:ATP-binding protein [Bacteroidales bacterium]
MIFYNRESELQLLREIGEASMESSRMTVMVGRRRIGKTKLLLHATEGRPSAYFFVSRKSESILCRQFSEEAERALGVPIGTYSLFSDLLEHLMRISQNMPFTLIIDEFQELSNINPSIIGDIQRVWDLHKDRSRINLLLSGSVYSMMHRIFEDEKEPLFSRASNIIRLDVFRTDVLKGILADHNPHYTNEDLLALYSITGGVPWYVELLMGAKAYTLKKMADVIFCDNSLFVNEGKNLLIEEFGKDYSIYFSILECIAHGISMRGEIETAVGVAEVGGYLCKLEKSYNLIRQMRPIFSKASSKTVRYYIADNFLTFWFRFFYKHMNYVESGSMGLLKQIFLRDYPTFSGMMLERYFRQQAKESGLYTSIGNFWDRKGGHEMDIILANELDRTLRMGEVKRQAKYFNPRLLQEKSEYFLSVNPQLHSYRCELFSLDMDDM